jgi:hypothetical protein
LCPEEYSLGIRRNFVLKQGFLSVSIIGKTKEYVERLPVSTLKRNVMKKFLIEMKKEMERENRKK